MHNLCDFTPGVLFDLPFELREGAKGRETCDISAQWSRYSSSNGNVHAGKLDGKWDEAHNDLIQHRSKSTVATSAELHHVYRT
jgi:hypothetical protein